MTLDEFKQVRVGLVEFLDSLDIIERHWPESMSAERAVADRLLTWADSEIRAFESQLPQPVALPLNVDGIEF